MHRPLPLSVLASGLALVLFSSAAAAELPALHLEPVVAGLESPTYLTHAGDERLFVTLQGGRILSLENGSVVTEPFLDITDRVRTGGVRGLFSIAFHPRYADNGLFFVNYTDEAGQSITSRFAVSGDDPGVALPDSERILLSIPQPFGNHNGGQLQFGPDGYLYVGTGDGGGRADPFCQAQAGGSLLGKLLRLDVDRNNGAHPYYAIPFDNPFVGAGDPLDEIWALGLRNPWRFSFDRFTGDLFIADVGEDDREEVNRQNAGGGGGRNYGWKVMEGTRCGDTDGCTSELPPCGSPVYTPPILEYRHGEGECAVSGGYVYRGAAIPALSGAYLYGDFCSGRLWAARRRQGSWTSEELPFRLPGLVSFGEDRDGELYLLAGDSVYRLAGEEPPCRPGARHLCLQHGRFRVEATWRTPGGATGAGTGVKLTDESGYFWFFNAGNSEMMVKVLDACTSRHEAFWVFAAGLTNVEVELVVTDEISGQERRYTNPQGRPFQPILDTRAFATCP